VTQWAIADTGPIVAFIDNREQYHEWAREAFHNIRSPLITCELVICEAFYLLKGRSEAQDILLELVRKGHLSIQFSLAAETQPVAALLKKYSDRPMSLADACLVRMAELNERHYIFTLDSDFKVYRQHGREPLKLICP